MLTVNDRDSSNIIQFFQELPDPRSTVNRRHLLGDVIVISICGVLAGCDGPTAIAKWAGLNDVWLKKHLALPDGILAKDTYRRVLSLLDPRSFQQCFCQWIDSLSILSDEEKASHRKLIAIDGKALRDLTMGRTAWEHCILSVPGHPTTGSVWARCRLKRSRTKSLRFLYCWISSIWKTR